MAIRPGAEKFIKKRSKRRTMQHVAESLKGLGATLIALKDRRTQLENEDRKLKMEREILDIRQGDAQRLKDAEDRALLTEERLKNKADIDQALDAAKFEEAKAENLREQKRHEETLGQRKTEAEKREARLSSGAGSAGAVQERAAARYRETVLGEFEDSPGKAIFNQIIRETPGEPGQQGYAKALRETASKFLLGEVDEEMSKKMGRMIRSPGILDDQPDTDKQILLEETLQWMVKNAKNLGWLINPQVAQEITAFSMPLVPPMRGQEPAGLLQSLPPQQAPQGIQGEEDFDKALLGG